MLGIYELKKVLKDRWFLLFIALLCLLNGITAYLYAAKQPLPTSQEMEAAFSAYPQRIEGVIANAQDNLNSLKTDKGYKADYQRQIISRYTVTKELALTDTAVRGYDVFLTYSLQTAFMIFTVLMTAAKAFLTDYEHQCLPYIRHGTSHSRRNTGAAKTAAVCLTALGALLLFSASSLAGIGFQRGLIGGNRAIQHFSAFVFCPYSLTGIQAVLWQMAYRYLGLLAFALTVSAAAILLRNYLFTYLAALGFYGVSYLLSIIPFQDLNHSVTLCNLYSLIRATDFFDRYHGLHLLSLPVSIPYDRMAPILLCLFGGLLFAGCIFFYGRWGHSRLQLGAVWKKWRSYSRLSLSRGRRKTKKIRMKKAKQHGILAYEFRKLWKSRLFIAALLLCVLGKGASLFLTQQKNIPAYELVYSQYMTKLEGELTPEKIQFISMEKSELEALTKQGQAAFDQYMQGLISTEEYESYRERVESADFKLSVLKQVEDQRDYLIQKEQQGLKGWFLYDTGWKRLFSAGYDVALIALLILVVLPIFTIEQESRVCAILRCSSKGRQTLWRQKTLCTLILSVILSVIFIGADVIWVIKGEGQTLPTSQAPAVSLQTFSFLHSQISLKNLTAIWLFVRLAACIFYSFILAVVASLAKKTVLSLIAALMLTVCPHLLTNVVPAVAYLDILSYMDGREALRLSAAVFLVNDYGGLILTGGLMLMIPAAYYGIRFHGHKLLSRKEAPISA